MSQLPSVNEYVEEVLPYIRIIARHVRGTSYDIEVEELVNEMVYAIIVEAGRKPEFLQQKRGFVLQFAGWKARNAANASRRTGGRFFDVSLEAHEDADEAGVEGFNLPAEVISTVDREHEVSELGEIIESVLRGMDPSYRTLVSLLYSGMPKNEIAAALDIHPVSLQGRLETLRKYLGPKLAEAQI